ncbi:MAG: nucleoside deaminase [Rhizobiaceae bacterium]|nr:nucleoside deaminase [Rhizobiaceae bacterium]
MDLAIAEAEAAGARGEVPIGAVIVLNGKVISRAGNETRALHDVTAHAEILAIRRASQVLAQERLTEVDLYVTLEPCTMCAGAISFARIKRLYIGAEDEKGGGVLNGARFFELSPCHLIPEVYSGFQAENCAKFLRDFFKAQR